MVVQESLRVSVEGKLMETVIADVLRLVAALVRAVVAVVQGVAVPALVARDLAPMATASASVT